MRSVRSTNMTGRPVLTCGDCHPPPHCSSRDPIALTAVSIVKSIVSTSKTVPTSSLGRPAGVHGLEPPRAYTSIGDHVGNERPVGSGGGRFFHRRVSHPGRCDTIRSCSIYSARGAAWPTERCVGSKGTRRGFVRPHLGVGFCHPRESRFLTYGNYISLNRGF